MTDYLLHYWPIAFRGEFVRAVLAYAGASWEEPGMDEIRAQKSRAPRDQIVPHMGPPVLTDLRANASIAQMPAILFYLAERHGLFPQEPMRRALCLKAVEDANDVLYEMTRHNGNQMWTDDAWRVFRPRLDRWMGIFEETGRRFGLEAGDGFLLGTADACLADLVTATLWGTMTEKLPPLRPVLDANAPRIAGLCDRMAARPALAAQRRDSDARFGDAWCGGQIEASLRAVI
ncbi:glutathione S-transferase [Tropicimonas sp. IMCC6043]|uniref:glutathione S-transferase n=1 Tax=Tropicimonas sp. IMCC6043 TaxID=2510645 RepID=UPI00101B73C0|nr:glutathione S-transferase [Tropicimonas sp. IMCC6043]RYH07932.1 glutathione S-transferase [Tropicimonas sp. IMCC6043]